MSTMEFGTEGKGHTRLAGGLNAATLARALGDAFMKLDPRKLFGNPVILATELVAVLATVSAAIAIGSGTNGGFAVAIAVWLWATVLFANFAESIAEGRGKAAADSLRATRTTTKAKLIVDEKQGLVVPTPAHELGLGQIILVEAGDVIPVDGEIIEGVASVNEAAITGESAPVIRESGGDRSAVTGGTTVVSDWIKVRVTARPGSTFLDRMIAMVEGADRRKTPNEIALAVLLAGLTLIFLIAVVTLLAFAGYTGIDLDPVVLGALFVCLIPTTIGGLLSAVGIAGMDRLLKVNVLATSGRAVEAAGDVDTLLLDKTGTITFGNRMATEVIPAPGIREDLALRAAVMTSLGDETPEGRSIIELARNKGISLDAPADGKIIPFTASTRLSGIDTDGKLWRKGAVDAILKLTGKSDTDAPAQFRQVVDRIARSGGTPLAIAEGKTLIGVIHLKDVVKPGVAARFADLRKMGLRTVMITGDNPVTAAAIAAEAGVDDFLAEATPEDKLRLIREEQGKGRLVAMCGDGANDAPALAQADVGVAMQTGAQAAREAGNMVDLDSDPTKVIEIVQVGKQMLITRGALTTFSIANDVAKYFAIIPALFVVVLPELQALNVMGLTSPESAILSAVIFNALIIVALIPLALRGVKYRAIGAGALLSRNLGIYGLGGLIAPFIGIKIIDIAITALGFA
ncbi:potassium-transporting ATPase subunit KdpB [Devosia sp. WQ 349K1]|uniref:potassium-transporting ATPase subunit KdpB n=1 Tax=Devosia sp. WQ 349K1 TaxID=2800329 RepID=UPI0020B36F8C|nr:potassium-transporting ATPase subunit KdpB [Devosia sp. WQ 349K1]